MLYYFQGVAFDLGPLKKLVGGDATEYVKTLPVTSYINNVLNSCYVGQYLKVGCLCFFIADQ